ncbi:hypothetical protein JDV02_003468 [Purpureocillium takamizusanense]|uniref:Protein kinase domain-containing protein n=1 Tax=Purpureocillium takamizusanense TaxID=2060973 RepID=A0A9Q8V8G5_9HYPO|nr:uncharacterized protein JDV02_003468 [Purpureocillium takamizusanense]UNI17090.1 hypothetical protein JDV02_003468 [Purpureocillium takamizusanense]
MAFTHTSAMSLHYLEEVSSGCGDRISLSIRWNDARLVVHLDPSATGNAIEDSLIEKYNAACIVEDCDEEEAMSEQILDAIVEAGRPIFDQLAPRPVISTSAPSDLHSLLFPKEYTFRFRTLDNTTRLILTAKHSPSENRPAPEPLEQPFHLTIGEGTNLPKFSTKDIRVLEKLLGDGYIARVLVNGQEMCSKVGNDLRADSAQRELTTLLKITTSQYADALRVPKLRGLVHTPDDGRIIGFLEDYVPSEDGSELSNLGDIETTSSIAEARRKKWALQVQETVHLLHQIGITWGDGKAGNVLIDHDTDDAWIIDFGGGWTDGWVEQELSGTIEGDELAVRKIFEFLGV